MKPGMLKIAALGLSALTVGAVALPTMARAQGGGKRQGRNADRDQGPLAGRLAKVTLQNMTFGESATLTVKTEEGETLALSWPNAKFHNDNAEATPSNFASKNPGGSVIAILYAQAQGKLTLREAWDLVSWNAELREHEGVQTGGITMLTNRVLIVSSRHYGLTKDTVFVKGGQTAKREDFSLRDTVYIKGDTSSGVPVALVVADTADGASSSSLDRAKEDLGGGITPRAKGNKRPPSSGSGRNQRPPSSGNGAGTTGTGASPSERDRQADNAPLTSRPPSSGSTNSASYTVRMFFKITDSSDNAFTSGAAGVVAKVAGIGDEKVECYGELRANGQKVWEIKREEAQQNQKRTGETITLLPSEASGLRNGSSWRVASATLSLSASLIDDDDLTNNDTLGTWTVNLNLAELANRGEKIFKSSKAELHIVVTR